MIKLKEHHSKNTIDEMFMNSLATFMLADLALSFAFIVDGLCISRFLGEDAMAAFGLIFPVGSVISMFAGIISAGTQTLCAKKIGLVKTEEANGLLMVSVVVTIAIATLLFGICLFAPDFLLSLLGSGKCTPEVIVHAKDYLLGYIYCIFPLMLSMLIIPIMQLDGKMHLVKLACTLCMVADVLFDLMNVFIFKGGMLGMALATSLAYNIELIPIIIYLLKPGTIFKISFSGLLWKELKDVVLMGIPVAARRFANVLKKVLMNRLVLGVASTAGLTALTVQGTVKEFGDVAGVGIGAAMLLLASVFIGEEDKTGLKSLFVRGLKSTTMPAVAGACLIAGSGLIARVFVSQPDSINTVIFALICYAISMPLLYINTMYINYLNGISEKKIASIYAFLSRSVVLLITAFVMSKFLGMKGIFIAYPLSELLMIFIVFVYIMAIRKKTVKLTTEDLLFLPDGFGHAESEEMDRSISSPEEVLTASEDAKKFCREHGVSRKVAFNTRLAIEEMCMNIIERGFADGKPHCIDLRVIVEHDTTLIRIRDNCPKFDPNEYLKLHNKYKEDPTSCIGLRVLYASAKKIDYINTLNMNNLIIVSEKGTE